MNNILIKELNLTTLEKHFIEKLALNEECSEAEWIRKTIWKEIRTNQSRKEIVNWPMYPPGF